MKRHLLVRFRLIKRRISRFLFHNVLHADDPPHRLAMGVAVAMFITFTPTVGIQMALVLFFSWLFRANKVVGLPIVWISNPATVVPIYYLCYRLGTSIMGGHTKDADWWAELANPTVSGWEQVKFFWDRFMEIAAPLWVGSLIVAALIAYASYYISYYAIYGYRMKRWGSPIPPIRSK